MADDLVELHGRCGRRFAAMVAGVGPEQWHDDTPCSEWDVRTLVHHLLYEQRWVPPMLEGMTIEQVGDRFEGDLMGDDASTWPGLLASSMEEAHAVVAQPDALERTVHLSFGDFPGQEYVMQLTADLAIRAWDLARATGQDDALNPGAVALLLPWTEANADLLAGSACSAHELTPAPTPRTTSACWDCSVTEPERPRRANRGRGGRPRRPGGGCVGPYRPGPDRTRQASRLNLREHPAEGAGPSPDRRGRKDPQCRRAHRYRSGPWSVRLFG